MPMWLSIFQNAFFIIKTKKATFCYLRTVNVSSASTNKNLPDELIFDNESVSDSKTIATKLMNTSHPLQKH